MRAALHTLIVVVSLAAARPATAGETVDQAVALVNSRIIYLSEIVSETKSPRIIEGRRNETSNPLQAALDRLINHELILRMARQRGLSIEESDLVSAVEQSIRDLVRLHGGIDPFRRMLKTENIELQQLKKLIHRRENERMLVGRTVSARISINRDDVALFAAEAESAGRSVESYSLSQILLQLSPQAGRDQSARIREQALTIYDELLNGAPFEELVKKYSADPYTAQRGGFIGILHPDELMPAVLDAVKELNPGQFSKPVKSAIGFQIFYLENKRTPRDFLFQQRFEEEYQNLVQQLRQQAALEMLTENFPPRESKTE